MLEILNYLKKFFNGLKTDEESMPENEEIDTTDMPE